MYLVKMGIQELLTKVYFSLSIATVAKVQLSAVSFTDFQETCINTLRYNAVSA